MHARTHARTHTHTHVRDQHVKQTDCLKDRPGPFPKAFPRAVRCVRGYDERYTCESTRGPYRGAALEPSAVDIGQECPVLYSHGRQPYTCVVWKIVDCEH
jgi:hypothetical protein